MLLCIFLSRNRLASGCDDPYFFRMMQRNYNSMNCVENYSTISLIFALFIPIVPDSRSLPRLQVFESVRTEKAIEAQPRGGVVSISLHDLGCSRACVSQRFGGWLGDGWGGWQTPRPSNEDFTKYTFSKIHRVVTGDIVVDWLAPFEDGRPQTRISTELVWVFEIVRALGCLLK